MESKNDIDKLFKDKLENREFEIKESFLADLEGKLDAQKPAKKYWGLIFFVFFAVVGVSFLAYYFTTNNVNDAVYSQISIENIEQDINSETVEHTVGERDLNNENATNGSVKTADFHPVDESSSGINEDSQFVAENQPETNNVVSGHNSNVGNSIKKTNSENRNEELPKTGDVTTNSVVDNGAGQNGGINCEKQKVKDNAEKTSSSSVASENNKVSKGDDSINPNKGSVAVATKEEVITSNKEQNSEKDNSTSSSEETAKQEVEDEGSSEESPVTDNLTSEEINEEKDNHVNEISDNVKSGDSTTTQLLDEKDNLDITPFNDTVANEEIMDATLLASDSNDIDSLSQEKEISEELSDTLSEDNAVINEEVSTPEDSDKKAKKWTLSVFGGPSLINKKVYGFPTDAYLAKRNDEESSIVSMSYGLRVNYNFSEKINVSLGANSVTYGEDVNYSTIYDTTTSNSTVSKDSSYLDYVYTPFQDSNGFWDTLVTTIMVDTTFMIDTTLIDTNAINHSGKNRFTYLQIPIMFGYKFTFNKMSVNVRIGGSYGILLKNTGNYVNYGGNNIEPPNLKKTMINIVASTTISYQLKKMNVFIEPKFRMNSGTIITHPEIKQRYTAVGCNFGLSFDF